MRLPAVLLLVLLLVGFAARPTVSAALTNGDVVLHPFSVMQLADKSTALEAGVAEDIPASVSACVSLGIMPDTPVMLFVPTEVPSGTSHDSAEPAKPRYQILRPPKSIA